MDQNQNIPTQNVTPLQVSVAPSRMPKSVFEPVIVDNGGPIFPPADERFNWGAFLMSWIHAVCHRQYKLAVVLFVVPGVVSLLSQVLSTIPFVGTLFMVVSPIVSLAISILYGKIGYRVACLGKEYQSAEELYQRERKYLWIGLALLVLVVLLFILIAIAVALMMQQMPAHA